MGVDSVARAVEVVRTADRAACRLRLAAAPRLVCVVRLALEAPLQLGHPPAGALETDVAVPRNEKVVVAEEVVAPVEGLPVPAVPPMVDATVASKRGLRETVAQTPVLQAGRLALEKVAARAAPAAGVGSETVASLQGVVLGPSHRHPMELPWKVAGSARQSDVALEQVRAECVVAPPSPDAVLAAARDQGGS